MAGEKIYRKETRGGGKPHRRKFHLELSLPGPEAKERGERFMVPRNEGRDGEPNYRQRRIF